MQCMVASSIPCKLSLCADRAHACAGDSYVSSGIDVACPTTQSVLAIASPHELHGDSWPSSSTGTRSFCCNHQYSVTAVTTSAGSITERYAYSAYGQPTILDASASVLSSSAINNRYTYTGREWDATLALHHFRARWMSPSAGRFLTRDPIGFKGGILLYGNYWWLRSADPYGLQSLNAGGGKGPTPPKNRDQNCKTCCCCPVGITATSAQPDDLPSLSWYYYQGIDITFTIMLNYQPAPAGAKDVNCKLSFQEFVDPSTTDRLASAAGYKEKEWTDQVASRPNSAFFTPWDDFNPKESKLCDGTAKLQMTDKSRTLGMKTKEVIDFWQWMGVTGGKDCNCAGSVEYVTHVVYNPPNDPAFTPLLLPDKIGQIPTHVKPLPRF